MVTSFLKSVPRYDVAGRKLPQVRAAAHGWAVRPAIAPPRKVPNIWAAPQRPI